MTAADHRRFRRAASMIAGAVLTLVMIWGCATGRSAAGRGKEPLRYLREGALLYARLSRSALADISPDVLPGDRGATLAPLVARTRAVAIATYSAGPGAARLDLALVGDYSRTAVTMALSVNPEWRASHGVFTNDPEGIAAYAPEDGVVLAWSVGTREQGRRPDPPKTSGKLRNLPVPSRFSESVDRDIFIWIPRPFTTFATALPEEGFDLPVESISIAATRSAPGTEPDSAAPYDTTITFIMPDEESARVYRPSLRFAWFALSQSLFGDPGFVDSAPKYTINGDAFTVSGVSIPASTFAAILGGA